MTMYMLAEQFVATPAGKAAIFAATAGATGALVVSVSVLVGRRHAQLERRLAGYDRPAAAEPWDDGAEGPESTVVQQGVDLATRLAGRTSLLRKVEVLLEQANVPMRAGEFLFYVPVFAVIAFLLLSLVAGTLAGLIGAVLALVGPVLFLRRRRAKRTKAFESMLPSTLTLMASSLRAGFSLLQALETVAQETRDPMQGELKRVFTEVQLGRAIDEALGDVAERMHSRDLEWTVMAIKIQREVGGNLAALLDTVADTMTQRQQLRREVQSLTAEGRLSAIVLSLFPPLMALVLYLIKPDYIGKLFSDPIGIAAVVVASVMTVVGWLWLQRIVDMKEST